MALRIMTILTTLLSMLTFVENSVSGEELPAPTGIPVSTHPVAGQRSIQVDIRLIEIPVGKMRQLGFEFATISHDGRTKSVGIEGLVQGTQYDSKQLDSLLEALRQNKLAHVLAEPRLVTLEGRKATIEVNAEVAMDHRFGKPSKKKMTGMRAKVVPKLIAASRCQVELQLEWSGITRDAKGVARLRKHHLDTAFTADSGKTMVVSTTTAQNNQAESHGDHTLLVLVTPTVLDPTGGNHRTAGQKTERR